MKTYEFHCGGDRGAWECIVDVALTPEDESLIKEYANNATDEFLSQFPPTDKIYNKVMEELKKQCDDNFNASTVVIRYPYGLKGRI